MQILTANKKRNAKELKLLYKELYHCFAVAKDCEQMQLFASEPKLTTFFKMVQQSLTIVHEVKAEKVAQSEEQAASGQVDDEDVQAIQTELYKVAGAATYIGEALDTLMSAYKGHITPLIEANAVPYFKNVLNHFEDVSEIETQAALYFFIQFVTECKKNTDPFMLYELCSQFLEVALKTEADVTDVR